jgi:GT2 family glycosyltransferase
MESDSMFRHLRMILPQNVRSLLRDVRAELLSIGLPVKKQFSQPLPEIEASRDISVVVAIRDSPSVLRVCLTSLGKYAPHSEVILVDDNSELGETRDIIAEFSERKHWKAIRNNGSMGHSRSCEAGARLATRPYLCLLNSDTIVTPWSWRGSQEAFEADSRIVITGPSTSYTPTVQAVPRAEYCRHYWSESQVCAFAQTYVSSRPARCWTDLSEVGGFAFFVRRRFWEELGGFDSNLPDYGNEFEFCRRASKQGWRIIWVANSYIHHLGHQSYKLERPRLLRRGLWAQTYIEKKHS